MYLIIRPYKVRAQSFYNVFDYYIHVSHLKMLTRTDSSLVQLHMELVTLLDTLN